MGDGFLFRVIRNPWVAVDSFLLLSGCLLAYLTFKELDRCKGRLNVPLFYLHRCPHVRGRGGLEGGSTYSFLCLKTVVFT